MNVLKYVLAPALLVGFVFALASGIGKGSGADLLKSVGYLAMFLTCLPQANTPSPNGRFFAMIKRASTPLMTLGITCTLIAFAWKNGWM